MTTYQIEDLIECVCGDLAHDEELGVKPAVRVVESDDYSVFLDYSSDELETSITLATDIAEENLRAYLTTDIYDDIRNAYAAIEGRVFVVVHQWLCLGEVRAEVKVLGTFRKYEDAVACLKHQRDEEINESWEIFFPDDYHIESDEEDYFLVQKDGYMKFDEISIEEHWTK